MPRRRPTAAQAMATLALAPFLLPLVVLVLGALQPVSRTAPTGWELVPLPPTTVASDVGVYLSRDGGRRWLRVGGNLPMVPVFELRHHPGTNTLYAATFGRSMWRVPLDSLQRR